jgi:DNA-binding CsgD family transcriptional regulator
MAMREHAATVGAEIACAQGDRARVAALLQEFLSHGLATPPGSVRFADGASPLQRTAAASALASDDRTEARAWLTLHDEWLAWAGAILGQSEGQALWAQFHRAGGDLATAREHAERALAHATEPRQPLALLAARRLLGELDTTEGRHGDAATHLDAALALAEACAAPYERALTLLALAELHLALRDHDSARAALDEARAILTPLEARPALARADALAVRLGRTAPPRAARRAVGPGALTAREMEVLRLVAQGLTNAQVADRLFLSPRTVDQHLRAIYGKLDVTTRAAAVRIAAARGLA